MVDEWYPATFQYRKQHDVPRDIDRLFAKHGLNVVMLGQPWTAKYFNGGEGPKDYDLFH